MDGNLTEFEIRRKETLRQVTAESDFRNGFVISGPGLDGRAIRFTEWSQDATAEAETPWGRILVRKKPPSYWQWVVTREGRFPAEVRMRVGLSVDFILENEVKLRFKNRTLLGPRVYRFKDGSGLIEIRTETTGLWSTTPLPSESKKMWKIRFVGQPSVDHNEALPPLAVWLCYYKILRGGPARFPDTMF